MLLSAGHGTRLRPLSDWVAKPLVPVGDGPALSQVLRRVRAALPEVRVVANAHHRAGDVEAWAEREGVVVSREDELLGTAGGLRKAGDLLGSGEVLVWNGDILAPLDVGALCAAHDGSTIATLTACPRERGQGTVGVGRDGVVVRLRGQVFGPEERGGDFMGVQIVGAAARSMLPRAGCLVGDVYLPHLRAGGRIAVHEVLTSFVDLGTVASYLAANRAWLGERGVSAWAAEDARISASVEGSVIGEGARVDAPCLRSVVWPEAHVREPVEDAVVTPYGVARP